MPKDWREVRDEIRKEWERIRFEEPEELKKLMTGQIDSRIGSYGQYFSVIVNIKGLLMSVSMYLTGGMVRTAQHPDFSLDQLKTLTRMQPTHAHAVLAFAGLRKAALFANEILESLDSIKTKEEFIDLMSIYMIYTARLGTWMHHMFPWGLCQSFTYTTPQERFEKTLKDCHEIFKKLEMRGQ